MKKTRNTLKVTEDGATIVKTIVPKNLWTVLIKYADTIPITPIQAYSLFLGKIESLINEGKTEFLGPEINQVIKNLTVNDQLGTSGLPPIGEFAGKLHRSVKTKSGFVGIYANGNGFRAMGKTVGDEKSGTSSHTIGTYPTAEQAAFARYLYYKKNNLYYGEDELKIENFRKENPGVGWSDSVILRELKDLEQFIPGYQNIEDPRNEQD